MHFYLFSWVGIDLGDREIRDEQQTQKPNKIKKYKKNLNRWIPRARPMMNSCKTHAHFFFLYNYKFDFPMVMLSSCCYRSAAVPNTHNITGEKIVIASVGTIFFVRFSCVFRNSYTHCGAAIECFCVWYAVLYDANA